MLRSHQAYKAGLEHPVELPYICHTGMGALPSCVARGAVSKSPGICMLAHVQNGGQDVLQIALQNNTYCLQTYWYPAAIPAVWSLVQFLRQNDHHTRPQTVMIAHPCIYGQIVLSLLIDSLAPTVRFESQFNINCTRHMCPTYKGFQTFMSSHASTAHQVTSLP